jgi:hypothetical protein
VNEYVRLITALRDGTLNRAAARNCERLNADLSRIISNGVAA